MFLLLLIICIITIVVGAIWFNKTRTDEGVFGSIALIVIGAAGVLIFIISTLCYVDEVVDSRYINEKIAVYEEQNAEIEEEISVIVQNYMKYETETYGQFKNENTNGITLVQLYPELKADELVQKQISIYILNNENIKQLKEKKIDSKTAKWWLYFGG